MHKELMKSCDSEKNACLHVNVLKWQTMTISVRNFSTIGKTESTVQYQCLTRGHPERTKMALGTQYVIQQRLTFRSSPR